MYTGFSHLAKEAGIELVFWNNTPLDLSSLGHQEISFPKVALHWKTDSLKNAIKHNELNHFSNLFNNTVFHSYKFKWNTNSLKNRLKTYIAKSYLKKEPSQEQIIRLRKKIKRQEQSTHYYRVCKERIKEVKPDLVFCASQRPIAAVAPMLAATALGIPTACAIFSWDNLPKATLVVEADHYLVWSEHMKKELETYYPFTKKSRVHITGTPQFENHYNRDILLSREEFYKTHNLDIAKEYICFSGDDITTSPFDPQYLADVSEAVNQYNQSGKSPVGIIFRRCPVDFSDRYDWVFIKYPEIITPILPLWESVGSQWDKKIPTSADLELQANIAHHTKLVVNVGSSMVFDYAAHNKPCAYLNYNPEGSDTGIKDIYKIYKYIHFQSMPSKEAVIWLDNKESILQHLIAVLDKKGFNLEQTNKWFEKIAHHPVDESSKRMISVLKTLK